MSRQDDINRFMSYVEVLSSGCWYWTGARSRGSGNKKWYGSFWVDGKSVRAHRWAAVVLGGQRELVQGEHRDHKCNFSMCVNPDHTEIVTHEENQRRKVMRKNGQEAQASDANSEVHICELGRQGEQTPCHAAHHLLGIE